MDQRKSRRYCAVMLAVSVCLRVCMFLGLDDRLGRAVISAFQDPRTAAFFLFLETGVRAEPVVKEPEVLTVRVQMPTPVPVTVKKKTPTKTQPEKILPEIPFPI